MRLSCAGGSQPDQEVSAVARFNIEAANSLIEYNRRRISQLARSQHDPLIARVVRQLELSTRSLERQRDEMLGRGDRA